MKKIEAVLFDLDGVLVDTAKYHYLSWKSIANKWDFKLTLAHNEKLKGVSRKDSLQKILDWAGATLLEKEMERYLDVKNNMYLKHIAKLSQDDLLPGVVKWLEFLKQNEIKIGLGSASKNAQLILEKLEINPFFQTLVDGNHVSKGKPDPEVFLKGSHNLKVPPERCLVVEDSLAGVEAAHRAQMKTLAIGDAHQFQHADFCFSSLDAIEPAQLFSVIEFDK